MSALGIVIRESMGVIRSLIIGEYLFKIFAILAQGILFLKEL